MKVVSAGSSPGPPQEGGVLGGSKKDPILGPFWDPLFDPILGRKSGAVVPPNPKSVHFVGYLITLPFGTETDTRKTGFYMVLC
jgi:hypothetical protein